MLTSMLKIFACGKCPVCDVVAGGSAETCAHVDFVIMPIHLLYIFGLEVLLKRGAEL